jgi:hypothetical protein
MKSKDTDPPAPRPAPIRPTKPRHIRHRSRAEDDETPLRLIDQAIALLPVRPEKYQPLVRKLACVVVRRIRAANAAENAPHLSRSDLRGSLDGVRNAAKCLEQKLSNPHIAATIGAASLGHASIEDFQGHIEAAERRLNLSALRSQLAALQIILTARVHQFRLEGGGSATATERLNLPARWLLLAHGYNLYGLAHGKVPGPKNDDLHQILTLLWQAATREQNHSWEGLVREFSKPDQARKAQINVVSMEFQDWLEAKMKRHSGM